MVAFVPVNLFLLHNPSTPLDPRVPPIYLSGALTADEYIAKLRARLHGLNEPHRSLCAALIQLAIAMKRRWPSIRFP